MIELLVNNNIPQGVLVDNILIPNYVRLSVSQLNSIKSIFISNATIPISTQEKKVLKKIISLYDNEQNLILSVKQRFSEIWEERDTLNLLKKWWETIPYAFTITEIGRVLAHANAQRYDSSLPPLN